MSEATIAPAAGSKEKREQLARILQQRLAAPKLRPVSFAQQRLWLLDQMEPGSAFYNVPIVFSWPGQLDIALLQRTIDAIVRRHETLRTIFITQDGQPMQRIAPSLSIPVTTLDLRHLPDGDQIHQLQRVLDLHARTSFDLANGPLMRVVIVRRGEESIAAVTLHHIICDGWSIDVLLREMSVTYAALAAGQTPPLAPLPLQYADYAEWQSEVLQGDRLRELTGYWREHLGGAPALLSLPLDRPRPVMQTYRGANEYFSIPAEVTARLRSIAQNESATMFMLLLAAFNVLLFRYCGQRDLVVGTPIGNRLRAEFEPLIGFFVNTLALRTRIAPSMSFRELLRQVRETTLNAYSHQDLPFEKLVEELQPERALSHNPLFQVMFAMQNASGPAPAEAAPPPAPRAGTGTAKFDLTLSAIEGGGTVSGAIEYNVDLFDRVTIEQMMRHFANVLRAIADGPDTALAEMAMLDGSDLASVLAGWNATETGLAGGTLHEHIFQQAARTPDHTAVMAGEERVSYRELAARAAGLAERLRRAGVRPGARVAVALERSPELVVALLGALHAGAAYVPLDPHYPAERLAFMLGDAQPAAVITSADLQARFAAGGAPVLLVDGTTAEPATDAGGAPDDLAYVLYTSGSTGKPKGVCISHRAAMNHMQWLLHEFPLNAEDVVLQRTPVSFDASVWEIFAPLIAGATLALAPADARIDPSALVAAIDRYRVTTLQVVPSLLRALLADDALSRCTSLRRIFCGGEALAPDLMRRLRELTTVEVVNLYGPTETTIDLTFWRCGEEPIVPIGRPVANMRVYVLDDTLRPVPPGVSGQLCAAGPQLGDGYLGRPGTTAAAFVPNPFAVTTGERLYLTGDVVRWRQDGVLEFLGRSDDQVKVRGFRIELGEIESALAAHPAVHQVAVAPKSDPAGGLRVVAYVVSEDDTSTSAIREWLAARLPQHMLPALIERIPALPLTANGKVDLRALPDPLAGRVETAPRSAPRSRVERELAAIWSELLAVSNVGLEDDFFELGGHSLSATQLVARIAARLHVELPLRTVFESPFLGVLAEKIEALSPASETSDAPAAVAEADCDDRILLAIALGEPASVTFSIARNGDSDDALMRAVREIAPAADARSSAGGVEVRLPASSADAAAAAILRVRIERALGRPAEAVRRRIAPEAPDDPVAWWTGMLAGVPLAARPAGIVPRAAASQTMPFGAEVLQTGGTSIAIAVAAASVMLQTLNHCEDVVVGVPFDIAPSADAVGAFMNVLPVRIRVPSTVSEVAETLAAANAHARVAWSRVAGELGIGPVAPLRCVVDVREDIAEYIPFAELVLSFAGGRARIAYDPRIDRPDGIARIGALLHAAFTAGPTPPPTPLEERISELWREILGRKPDLDEPFAGSASQLLALHELLTRSLAPVSVPQLIAHPSVRAQALLVTTIALKNHPSAASAALLARAEGTAPKEVL